MVALGYKHGPLSLAPGMTDSMVALGYKHGPFSLAPGMTDSTVALGYKNMTPSLAPEYVLQCCPSSEKKAAEKASHDRAKPARRSGGTRRTSYRPQHSSKPPVGGRCSLQIKRKRRQVANGRGQFKPDTYKWLTFPIGRCLVGGWKSDSARYFNQVFQPGISTRYFNCL